MRRGAKRRDGAAADAWCSTRSISGLEGRAAEAVGQKLKTLSTAQQVICITHLPQIAAFADQHFLIEKAQRRRGGRRRACG